MGFLVYQAKIQHIEAVSTLFNDYRVFYQQPSDLTLAKEFIRERIINKESIIFVAENTQGEIVGFTQLYPSFSSVSAKRIWILNDLYVAQSARCQGVATLLMDRAKTLAVETNAKGIILETGLRNKSAQRLYESLGYQLSNDALHYFLAV